MKICCVELKVGAVLLLVVGGVVLLVPLLSSIFWLEVSSLFLTKIDPNSTKRELNLATKLFEGLCLKVKIDQLGGLFLKASGLSKTGTSFWSHVLVDLVVVVVTG